MMCTGKPVTWRRRRRGIQGYWSRKARDKGILTERDLERYLSA